MYYTKVIDEISKGKRRYILEYSGTEHCYIVKAVFKIMDEALARKWYEELSHKRGPRADKPEAPAQVPGKLVKRTEGKK